MLERKIVNCVQWKEWDRFLQGEENIYCTFILWKLKAKCIETYLYEL